MPAPSKRLAEERGAVSVTAVLLLAAAAALAYAILGATVTDSDTYGSAAIPSKTSVDLPGGEVELSIAVPAGASLTPFPPPDLRISVGQPGQDPLRVDARGGEEVEEDGYIIRPVAAVFPSQGAYEIDVTSNTAAAVGGRLLIGEGTTGAIGTRFERIGELITGPFGILALILLVLALLLPSFQRALRNNR
jgi:hypothetical protein